MKKYFLFVSILFLLANSPDNNNSQEKQDIISPSKLVANDFMVVSAHPLATQAGYNILAKGGNAIDAAIAVQMVLNVVEPYASGIGGGGFLLYYDAKKNKSTYYNGREKAPKNINPKVFLDKKGQKKTFHEALKGGVSVGVPGILKILSSAHQKHGKLPWFELFYDAINTASLGYKVTPRIYKKINNIAHIAEFPETSGLFFNEQFTLK